jgi:Trk-type K+ transport system membrane component
MAGGRYNYVFDSQPQQVSIPWFALFQAVSAFSNTGMSLADQSMIPFQEAYLMVAREWFAILLFCILTD